MNAFKNKAKHIIESLNSLPSVKEQINHIKSLEKILGEWSTYASIASLEYSRDTFSDKNKKENEFYDNIQPEMQEISTQYADAILQSPFRSELEKEYGPHIFNLKEIERKTFKPAISFPRASSIFSFPLKSCPCEDKSISNTIMQFKWGK